MPQHEKQRLKFYLSKVGVRLGAGHGVTAGSEFEIPSHLATISVSSISSQNNGIRHRRSFPSARMLIGGSTVRFVFRVS